MNIQLFLKRYGILIIVGMTTLLILLSFFVFGKPQREEQPPEGKIPPPSASPITGEPVSNKKYFVIAPDEEKIATQDAAVVKLINVLPYKGKNIHFSYSFTNFQFTLQENELEQVESEKEFNALLTQYGIKNRSWLKNLIIQKIRGTQEETSGSPGYLFGR